MSKAGGNDEYDAGARFSFRLTKRDRSSFLSLTRSLGVHIAPPARSNNQRWNCSGAARSFTFSPHSFKLCLLLRCARNKHFSIFILRTRISIFARREVVIKEAALPVQLFFRNYTQRCRRGSRIYCVYMRPGNSSRDIVMSSLKLLRRDYSMDGQGYEYFL